MSLYPEQKKVIDNIFSLLSKPETVGKGSVEVQMQLMIQWMLVANSLEVIAENSRHLVKLLVARRPSDVADVMRQFEKK